MKGLLVTCRNVKVRLYAWPQRKGAPPGGDFVDLLTNVNCTKTLCTSSYPRLANLKPKGFDRRASAAALLFNDNSYVLVSGEDAMHAVSVVEF